ncbi:MAG TPA: lipopolysaccharide biosynthesis protein [Micromonosporaceae bacterium]
MDATRPVSAHSVDRPWLTRNWWLVAAALATGVAVGALIAQSRPQVYESTAVVLVAPVGSDPVSLDTEAQLVRSEAVAELAGTLLRTDLPADDLANRVRVTAPADSSVLRIAYRAGSPHSAQAGAHAFAAAYLRYRGDQAQADLAARTAAVRGNLRDLQTQLAKANARAEVISRTSTERAALDSQRSALTEQIAELTSRLNDLTATRINPGTVIADAAPPRQPVSPRTTLYLVVAALVGLLVGVLAALGRERLDPRVRRPGQVPRLSGLPVLTHLARSVRGDLDDLLPEYSAGGQLFNRLRNEVIASLDNDERVVLVTGASAGLGSTVVAANLATALARTGCDVVLICAYQPETRHAATAGSRLFGVAAVPGLSDLLAGRVGLAAALQRTPRQPWLRVVTTGGTATAAGLASHSPLLRDILRTLRRQAEFVVVAGPSTATSADAQTLASLADAAIVTIELGGTRRREVTDAADQLRRVGTPVLGAVVLDRLPRVPGSGGAPVPTPPSTPATATYRTRPPRVDTADNVTTPPALVYVNPPPPRAVTGKVYRASRLTDMIPPTEAV